MIYTINQTNYRDFAVFEENKLPGRSYFIPFSSPEAVKKTDILTERYESDRIQMLSGEDWRFCYFADGNQIPELLDTDKAEFDTIGVPSTWQRTGYESPCYLNAQYAFDEKCPRLPERVPAGVYLKKFTIGDLSKNYLLTFLGAISSLEVYLNGSYVGYSEGAHNPAEFNINSFLLEGENELLCVVRKWSTATYLECQDMFRENGIFRDVYITRREKEHLHDIRVSTRRNESGTYGLRVLATVRGENGVVEAVLRRDGGVIARGEYTMRGAADFIFKDLQVTEWNAEEPVLYELTVTLSRDGCPLECARQYVGFKEVRIEGETFLLNGRNIKIKGVNHHDTNPKTGYVMTAGDLLRDVTLMKAYNVNALRTSHYPPDPMLLALCDKYGLYVVDEADIETHGCNCKPHSNMNLISNDLKWAGHYLDRVRRMYERDKNHPSIIMWSLGNESGGYRCQDKCFDYLRDVSPEIPVHYEGARHTKRRGYDVISEMYTPYQKVGEIGAGKAPEPFYKGKPFFLCEYAHAMGVGPGGLEDYMKAFYSSDKLMGGCIWEWADHAVYHEDGPYRYTYGGDHGEERHSGSFCVDGLMYPDRTPHTGALQMRAVYRPLRAKMKQPGVYLFKNTNSFRDSGYIDIQWELLCGGAVTSSGAFSIHLQPGDCKPVAIAHPEAQAGQECFINFTYTDRESGTFIAKEQLELSAGETAAALDASRAATLEETKNEYTVIFAGGRAVFRKADGQMVQYQAGGRELLHQAPVSGSMGPVPLLYRAPLDNDANVKKEWERLELHRPAFRLKNISVSQKGGLVTVTTLLRWRGSLLSERMQVQVEYTVDGAGAVLVQCWMQRHSGALRSLPRFGVQLELRKDLDTVTYYGRGESENLSDLNAHTTVGMFQNTVERMQEPYIRPQESGFHTETRWMSVTGRDGKGLRFCHTGTPFTFEVHPYTAAQLRDWAHTRDVINQGTTCVSIDGYVRGAGSASCGPQPGEEHIIDVSRPLSFSFLMKPEEAEQDS